MSITDPTSMTIAELEQFIPRVVAVIIDGERFDLTNLAGVKAWVASALAPDELFHFHPDDLPILEATFRAGVPFPTGRNAVFSRRVPT
ncbi:hypothetical protein [Mesorhizobium sp.]|uniref:hypothetical protein n=1 Tax=Mesorhizobium sp. TaxID=1871066 RepID=UPI000FE66018|nr:hypothetical protein [Mesorhizobium sp.]RWM28491.1 MAG: hypothetical protein EOR74_09180 [Mesorhizobium sp.]